MDVLLGPAGPLHVVETGFPFTSYTISHEIRCPFAVVVVDTVRVASS